MTVEEFLQGDYETGPGDGEGREELARSETWGRRSHNLL